MKCTACRQIKLIKNNYLSKMFHILKDLPLALSAYIFNQQNINSIKEHSHFNCGVKHTTLNVHVMQFIGGKGVM